MVARDKISFLRHSSILLHVESTFCISVHLLRTLGCFCVQAAVNKASANSGVKTSRRHPDFSPSGGTLRRALLDQVVI